MIFSIGIAQPFVGGTLASLVGRLWALRISIAVMIIGVYEFLSSSAYFPDLPDTASASSKLFPTHMPYSSGVL
jgi:hypothetical protein